MSLGALKPKLKKVLRTKPRKFQAQGIDFLNTAKGLALVGDDMGVGKTLQVLGFLALHPEARPAVIVCPSNAKYEWEEQIFQHTRRLECQVLEGKTPYEIESDIVIINYDIITKWEKALLALRPYVLVMDECHYVKNRKAQRTVTCRRLSRPAKMVIPMSGTPIINRPVEFFPVLNMMFPKRFRSFWKYAFRYCKPRRGWRGRGWVFPGAKNTEELHNIIKPFMIRRMKSEVLGELPPKQRIRIPVNLSNQSEYEKAQESFLSWYGEKYGLKRLKKARKAEGFVKVGQLKQLAAHGKIEAAIRWINDYLDATDGKLVVFCYHRAIFQKLAEKYAPIAAKGGKDGRKRKAEIQRFQTDEKCRLFIASLKADKEAITLTKANAVLFIEMGWTPGEHDQAEDRINRIGQEAESITAYYLLARNSIDMHIWDLIKKKRQIIAQILDGEEAEKEAQKVISISTLMKKIHRKEAA